MIYDIWGRILRYFQNYQLEKYTQRQLKKVKESTKEIKERKTWQD